MKFSELWLREWVDHNMSCEQLAQQITLSGLEVEECAAVADEFSGVVVGEVVACVPHPNADKLRVTKVNIAGDTLLNIVCGAPNCRAGLKVAVATIGALLPGNFKIKAAKLRGEPSQGMLCSAKELAIGDDSQGIIELDADAPVGANLRDYWRLDDHSIDVSVTPNRADCFSMRGIARDVAALNGLPLTPPDITAVPATIADTLSVQVEAPADCPRYLGRVIKGINPAAITPLWMKEKLQRGGIRCIDSVVDVTNYVLLELGQPMHAFSLAKIAGGIIVRKARNGEQLQLLDGNEIILDSATLVIADQQGPLALAGVFGGKASGVENGTRDILLESAFFAPASIAGRARQYGLRTEASHRYERGVDPQLQHQAMQRATRLLLDICGGAAGPVIDVSAPDYLPQADSIRLRRSKLDALIGQHIASDQVSDILRRLGFSVSEQSDHWQVLAPSWRFDVTLEEDLIEEVARIYGYHNINDQPVQATLLMNASPETVLPLPRIKTLLADRDYQEVITYSFVDPALQQRLHPEQCGLVLPAPISSEMSVMRLSLWSGLLTTLLYNQHRQQQRIRIFETGLRFVPDEQAMLGVRQEMMLAGAVCGNRCDEHWSIGRQPADFFDIKGDVEAILQLTGHLDQVQFRADEIAALHPGQTASIWLAGQKIGMLGVLHPQLEQQLGLHGQTLLFELQCSAIAGQRLPLAAEISRFPSNRRDIALVVAESINAVDILNECRKVGGNQLVEVNLFDVYQGKGVAEGQKSLAISLYLQDVNRTLADDEITVTVAKCVTALKERFNATLRD